MKILKARNYSVKEGHYSVWVVLCSARDIASIARSNAANKTMKPVTYFKLVTKMGSKDTIAFSILSNRDKMDAPVKTWNFKVKVVTDEDANTDVFFTPSEPMILCDKAYGMPHNKKVSELQYHFSCDFLNYTSGSSYRLFEDLLKSGIFAEVDGKAYANKEETPEGFTSEDEKDVKEFLAKLKEAKVAEYAKRDELNGKTHKPKIAKVVATEVKVAKVEDDDGILDMEAEEDEEVETKTQVVVPEDLEEENEEESDEENGEEYDDEESDEESDDDESDEESADDEEYYDDDESGESDDEEDVESSESDEEEYDDDGDSSGDDDDDDADSEVGDEAEEEEESDEEEYEDDESGEDESEDESEEYEDDEESGDEDTLGEDSAEEVDDTLEDIDELIDEDEDDALPKIKIPVSAD